MSGSDPLYAFLPLALAGFTTAVILGVQWFIGPFSDRKPKFRARPIHLKRSKSMKQISRRHSRSVFLRLFALLAVGAAVFHPSATHAATEAAATTYSWERIGEATLDLYRDLLGQRR